MAAHLRRLLAAPVVIASPRFNPAMVENIGRRFKRPVQKACDGAKETDNLTGEMR